MSIKKTKIRKEIERKQKAKKSVILHSSTFVVVNALLFIINIATTPDILWIIFPFFGWLVGLTLHSVVIATMGMKSDIKKGLILHLTLFIIVNILLFIINLTFTPTYLWALYPFFGWLVAVVLHFTAYFTSKMISGSKKALLFHISIYISVMVLLIVINVISSQEISWALYPLIFWGATLIMHGVIYAVYLAGKPSTQKTKKTLKKKGPRRITGKRPLDKARALRKRSRLLSATQKKEEISAKTSSELNQKAQEKKVTVKPKKGQVKGKTPKGLTEEEQEDLKKTESEVDLEEKEAVCVVHKGSIVGTVYICPKCKTYYCLKCANALVEKREKCWTCESDITP
jgi:hypothetical protein